MRYKPFAFMGQQNYNQIMIIGPNASTLFPNSASLESKLISSSITNFEIVGTNVYAASSTTYTPVPNMFFTSSDIFTVIMYGAQSVSSGMFKGSQIVSASFNDALSIGDAAFENSGITYVSFPKVQSLNTGNNFRNATSLTFIDLPSLTYVDGNQNFRNSALVTFSGSALPTVFRFNNAFALKNLYVPVATTIVGDAFSESGLNVFSSSAILTLQDNAFRNATAQTQIYLPGLSGSTAIGGSTGQTGTFQDIRINGNISVPSFYSSSNAGAPDGDLVYISSSRGWTINYL